jgi:hypothetical protein
MVMINTFETLAMLGKFLFSFFLLFVWVPAFVIRFDKQQSSLLDKLFISLTHSTLFFIIAVHLLVGIRLLETFSLFAIAILCIIAVFLLRKRLAKHPSLTKNVLTSFFDFLDDREYRKIVIKKFISLTKNTLGSQLHAAKQAIQKHPILIGAYILVFGVAIVDRFRYSFTHLAFASSDSYVHLGWSKYMATMQIYLDGVYPYGFESILASLYRVVQLDLYIAIRFLGPLTAILMTLSLVFALRKMIGKDYITILLTVFLLFFSTQMMIGNEVILWRQLSALSMEYAAIFLLPGITFFYLFFKNKNRYYLLLAAECYAITAFTHPFVTVTMTFAFLAVGISHFRSLFKNKTLLRILLYMGAAGALGILPPVIGLLAGKPFHGSSINYARGEFKSSQESVPFLEALLVFLREQPFITILYSFTFVYMVVWIFHQYRNREHKTSTSDPSPLILAAIFYFFMIISYITPKLGWPTLVPVDRQPVFLTMSGALLTGIVLSMLAKRINLAKDRMRLQFIGYLTIILLVWFLPGQKSVFPLGDFHQYDEAMRGYLDIKSSYPFKNWVIISPVDELGVILGYGYHYELWEFVRDLEDSDKHEIKFTTPYAFLYVEKVPIDIMKNDFRPITREDAEMPFPIATTGALTEFYYGANIQNRRILQAKAYYWAEEYMKKNKDMKVFLETPNMKIYEIDQGQKEVIIRK